MGEKLKLVSWQGLLSHPHPQASSLLPTGWVFSVAHQAVMSWNFPGQNTGVGSRSLLQGIFPTQGSNPGLLHCKQILYQLSHREALWGLRLSLIFPVFIWSSSHWLVPPHTVRGGSSLKYCLWKSPTLRRLGPQQWESWPADRWIPEGPLLFCSWVLRSASSIYSSCCCSITKSCPTLCDPMDCSTPVFPVLHHLLEFAQTHVHCHAI